jgi:ppGpp synthetase/RelA/SpoT-type nucleotidyltranferase
MPKKMLDKENLRIEHSAACQKYENLAKNLQQALKTFLNDAGIDVLDVYYRIKKFDSFWEKIQRKGYEDPFQQTEDICGLRIICYYLSDLDKISSLINSEFDVIESVDKAELLEPDRFGYRTHHFIVTVKKEWLNAPNYRGLDALKAEIQVRTILMHAWADIEHKLAYKKQEHVPYELRRRLSRLSAKFEEDDEQLDTFQKEREEYKESLVSDEVKQSGRFDVTQKLNIDSLQAFLDFYFPDRAKSIKSTSELLDEIMEYGISIKDLVEGYERVRDVLPDMEKEVYEKFKEGGKWAQVGVVRHILDITHDNYWRRRKDIEGLPDFVIKPVEKWRDKLSKQKQ